MRPAEVVRRSAEYLARHGVDSSRQEAETLLMRVLGVSRSGLYARSEGLDARTARLFSPGWTSSVKNTRGEDA